MNEPAQATGNAVRPIGDSGLYPGATGRVRGWKRLDGDCRAEVTAMMRPGEFGEASDEARETPTESGRDSRAIDYLGKGLFELRRFEEAEPCWRGRWRKSPRVTASESWPTR